MASKSIACVNRANLTSSRREKVSCRSIQNQLAILYALWWSSFVFHTNHTIIIIMAPYRYDDYRRHKKKKREKKVHGIKGNKELKRMGKNGECKREREDEKKWNFNDLLGMPADKQAHSTLLGWLTIQTATSHHNIDCSQWDCHCSMDFQFSAFSSHSLFPYTSNHATPHHFPVRSSSHLFLFANQLQWLTVQLLHILWPA